MLVKTRKRALTINFKQCLREINSKFLIFVLKVEIRREFFEKFRLPSENMLFLDNAFKFQVLLMWQ